MTVDLGVIEASPAVDVTNLRLVVAYRGTTFHGFVAQPGVPSVGGLLTDVVSRALRVPPIELVVAGRTDRGVHAWGQVVSFTVPTAALHTVGSLEDGLERLQRVVNKVLDPEIVVRSIEVVDPGFDARYSATARLYRYTVVNRPWPDPFLTDVAWHVAPPLDRASMTLACDPLIGLHDFSSFCRRPKRSDGAEVPLHRRIHSIRWEEGEDGVLSCWIEAKAFCHQMVRSIVGTLVEVGRGKKKAGEIMGIIEARDRRAAGDLAPPHGLCLWSVRYPDDDDR